MSGLMTMMKHSRHLHLGDGGQHILIPFLFLFHFRGVGDHLYKHLGWVLLFWLLYILDTSWLGAFVCPVRLGPRPGLLCLGARIPWDEPEGDTQDRVQSRSWVSPKG